MGLRTKFNLVLGFCMLLGILTSGLFAYNLLQKNAREEVLQAANIMMESALAVRHYTVQEVRPLLAVQQRRQFLSQSVPAYAASRYITKLQESHPEYQYKEAALNPTNPTNRATDWETDIINWFKNHRSEEKLIGERQTPMGRSLYVSRPIEIKSDKCLGCHGVASEAPQTFIDIYGTANGFGWEVDEVIGAQIVSVPMEVPLQRAEKTFYTFMGVLIAVFTLVFIFLNVVLHRVVIKPVTTISERANQVSMGDLNVSEFEVKGTDEIATLSQSFNRMQRSMIKAISLLEEDDVEQDDDMDAETEFMQVS